MIAQLGRVVVKTDVAHERFAQVDVTENKYNLIILGKGLI
jgi:uncharacterized membrane protein